VASGDPDVIRPDTRRWPLHARERELFESAKNIPTWRLADVARRALLDVCKQLGDRIPTPDVELVDELDAATARRLAAIALGQIAVRALGAQMTLIAAGYEREALAQARTATEVGIRIRQSNEDGSGDVAKAILKGRRPRNLKQIARRYGEDHLVELLDHFAHADARSIRVLGDLPSPGQREGTIELQPQRGRMRPAQQLYEVGFLATFISCGMVEACGLVLRVSPWVSTQLRHYADNPLPFPL
jgi:hypothetical protein